MSYTELSELKGTLARDSQRAQQPLNMFFAEQQRLQRKRGQDAVEKVDLATCTLKAAQKELRATSFTITHLIGEVQDARIGRDKLKDINDRINVALKHKHNCEKRIAQLQRPLTAASKSKIGAAAPKYQYFGAYKACEPSTEDAERAALEQEAAAEEGASMDSISSVPSTSQSVSEQLTRRMTAEYFGIGIDETEMVLLEAEAERRIADDRAASAQKKQEVAAAEANALLERKRALMARFGK
eukprot:PhM_4_TR7029/c0_g1_i1/m.58101/K12870/ISY1; pre-mRNA-splicing factor ISY1